MVEILRSNQQAQPNLTQVDISRRAVENFVKTLKPGDLGASELDLFGRPWEQSEFFKLSLIFNSINFCYWAEKESPKWNLTIDGRTVDGSAALAGRLEELAAKDPDLLAWPRLAQLDLDQFGRLLGGNDVKIPLLRERWQNLVALAEHVQNVCGGDSDLILQDSAGCARRLLARLIRIPGFDDQSALGGQKVYFYKRAQLQVKMFSDWQLAQLGQPLANLPTLTAFADYKVPQILRHVGILRYSPALAEMIDNYQLIPKDSKAENEIRIGTICAVDQLATQAQKQDLALTAAQVDSLLWQRAAANTDPMKPYHRTYTTAY